MKQNKYKQYLKYLLCYLIFDMKRCSSMLINVIV